MIATTKKSRAEKASIPESLRWYVWERDNFTCYYCNSRRFLSIDHKIPESRGGTLDPKNLITACRKCNSSKGARTPQEFHDSNPAYRTMQMFGWMFGNREAE